MAAVDVQAYAARFADRLAAVVLDSGIPINDIPGSTFGVDAAQGLLDVAAARCAADDACAASTPDPRAAVEQMVTTLGTSPVTRTASDPSGEDTIDQARIASFIGDDDASVDVVAAALALAGGNPEPLRQLDARFPGGEPDDPGDAATFSIGANFAGICNDGPMPYDAADPVDIRHQLGAGRGGSDQGLQHARRGRQRDVADRTDRVVAGVRDVRRPVRHAVDGQRRIVGTGMS